MPPSAPPPPSSHSPLPMTSTPPPDVLQRPNQSPQKSALPTPPTTSTASRTLRVGTRGSPLALAQVSIFTSLLSALQPTLPTQTIPISVAGDRDKTTDLYTLAQAGKSVWTEEMEVLLLKGEIDCIVHSLKDVPTKVVEGCSVLVVGERGERRDCVVFPNRGEGKEEGGAEREVNDTAAAVEEEAEGQTATASANPGTEDIPSADEPSPNKKRRISPPSSTSQPQARLTLSSLPPSSIVGTSSIRRSAMIRRRYPHLRIQDVRGNVGTRLRKLDDPLLGFDCLILAGAGLQRVGLGGRVDEWLSPDGEEGKGEGAGGGGEHGAGGEWKKEVGDGAMLHAVGQGAIGLEIRAGDEWLLGLLAGQEDGTRGVVVNRVSWECQAERSLLRTLEGGCSVPVGVSCRWEQDAETETETETTLPSATSTKNPEPGNDLDLIAPPPSAPSDPLMRPGTLHMLASVTSVDGTECVAASQKQWVSSDMEADNAGWELARVLVERGAERILKEIGLNRGMLERGDGA